MLYKIVTHLARRLSRLLALKNKAAIWRGAHGKELKAASSKNLKPYKELNDASNHISGSCFPSGTSDKMAAPVDTLTAAL